MQDIFIEYLVKKRKTPATAALRALMILGVVVFCIVLFLFSPYLGFLSMLAPFLAVGAVIGAYYLITGQNIEYEYSVTNGELDVDKIIAQRKRRRLVTVNCREVETFGRYRPAEHAQKSYQHKIIACDATDSEDVWCCTVRLKEKGLTLVVFNANQKMLDGIKPFLPRPVMHQAFRVGQ